MKGILINKENVKLSSKPKISAVAPCFNCKSYLIKSIRSIQNQNFTDLEIIIVNDHSSNDTLLFLQNLQKEDPRIKILTNKKNMGILYSRTIGTLSTKGKYIFPFDCDDMFLDKNVFWIVSNIADKDDLDIVVFDLIKTDLYPNIYSSQLKLKLYKTDRKPNVVLFQPELGYQPTRTKKNNIKNIEIMIFSRCIKSNIYKQALNKLGKERYSRYMNLVEDIINNFIIFNTAKSMKYIQKCGYLYIQRRESESHRPYSQALFLELRIYLLDVFIEFSQDTFKHKKIIVKLIYFCLGNKALKTVFKKSKYCYNLFISCLDRTFNCKYISNEYKNEIRRRIKLLDFFNYHL